MMIKSIHPAWRFILALKSRGIDPRDKGLPLKGGCESPNEISKLLSDLLEALNKGGNSINKLFCRKKHGGQYSTLYAAYRLFSINDYRLYIETCLMEDGSKNDKSKTNKSEVASELEIDPVIIGVYKQAFFDVSVFKSRIDELEYLELIANSQEKAQRKAWLRDRGYFSWLMGLKAKIGAKDIMNSLLADTYYRYVEAKNTSVSVKWCELALKIASSLIDEKNANNFMEEISLALKLKKPEFKAFSGASGLKDIKNEHASDS